MLLMKFETHAREVRRQINCCLTSVVIRFVSHSSKGKHTLNFVLLFCNSETYWNMWKCSASDKWHVNELLCFSLVPWNELPRALSRYFLWDFIIYREIWHTAAKKRLWNLRCYQDRRGAGCLWVVSTGLFPCTQELGMYMVPVGSWTWALWTSELGHCGLLSLVPVGSWAWSLWAAKLGPCRLLSLSLVGCRAWDLWAPCWHHQLDRKTLTSAGFHYLFTLRFLLFTPSGESLFLHTTYWNGLWTGSAT